MMPIFLGLIGAIFYKEKLGFWAWFGIFLGFLGIILIMQPNLGLTKSDFTGIIN